MTAHATGTHDLESKWVCSLNSIGTRTQLGFVLQVCLFMEEDQAQKACGTRVLVLFHLFLRIKSCPVGFILRSSSGSSFQAEGEKQDTINDEDLDARAPRMTETS